MMRSRIRISAAALLFVATLAAPAIAAADTTGGGGDSNGFGTISVTIGSTARLQARLIVNVPVTITCTPPVDAVSVDGVFEAVQVMQASAKSVATGDGFAQFACDGLAHTTTTAVVGKSIPFHGGKAIASVEANVCGTLADFTYACTTVITPWTTIKIGG
jgi:hypothetical protein